MKKVILICNAGLSSGMLAKKIEQASNNRYQVNAYSEAEFTDYLEDVELILLGPQIRFLEKQIKNQTSIPVELINPMKYGIMDGEGVLKDIDDFFKGRNE